MRFDCGGGEARGRGTMRVFWWYLIAGLFVGGGVILGVMRWRCGLQEDNSFHERSDEALKGLTCFDVSRNLDEYWRCMVRGYDVVMEGKLPKWVPPEDFEDGYEYYTRRKVVVKSKGKRRRWRRSHSYYHGGSEKSNVSYEPYDANYSVTFTPLRIADYQKEFKGRLTHDYHRMDQISEVLYERDVNSKDHQSEPPWSYEGFFPPKEWHLLDLKKFYQPVKQQYDLRMASFKDFGTETLFMHPEKFSSGDEYPGTGHRTLTAKLLFWDPKMVEVAYHNKTSPNKVVSTRDHWPPQYVLDALNETHNQDTTFMKYLEEKYLNQRKNKSLIPKEVRELMDDEDEGTLAKHDPKAGFYSSMRFLIPPGVNDDTVRNYLHEGLLPHKFNRPGLNYIDFGEMYKYVKALVDDYEKKKDLSRKDEYRLMAQVADWFIGEYIKKNERVYSDNSFQFPGFKKQMKEDVTLIGHFLNFLEEKVTEQRVGPRDREYYSLPLLPHPFKMCSHSEPSPINIKKAELSSLTAYTFPHNFCKRYPVSFRFRDDGTHVLIARFQGKGLYANDGQSIRGGIIKGQDLWLDEIHIHIGKTETTGSEHKFNGTGYAMELQFIFTITGSDPTQPYHYVLARQAGDLFQYREKLVLIVALLVEVKENPRDPYLFEPLAQAASVFRMQQRDPNSPKFRGYTTEEPVWALSDFMPPKTEKYYTYRGSLTIPPCFSHVFWSVYKYTLEISPQQFKQLQMWPLPGTDDTGMLAGNVRSMDDFYVEEEEKVGEGKPPLTQAQKATKREEREGRIVLLSDPEYFITDDDYYFDYYARSPNKILPSTLLLTLLAICVFYL